MHEIIDLRSDTVTKPTNEMRAVMAKAKVGDDVYKDDDSVNELERYAAEIMGKEKALFVPSGTMGNQICIKTHTNPADEIILHTKSHIFVYEAGAAALISNILTKIIDGPNGAMDTDKVKKNIQQGDLHHAKTTLICVENTHNVSGGIVLELEHMGKIYEIARENDIKVHLDGARIFNAAAALNVDVKEIAKYSHSVMFCLSKGLGAPVGSIICGNEEFINKAMKIRKMLGGAMRQAGILASAGLYALKTMPSLLYKDHEKSIFFMNELYNHKNINIDRKTVQTNMVNITLENTSLDGYDVSKILKRRNILVNGDYGSNKMRFVFHRDVDEDDVRKTIQVLNEELN
jgi:threonine aldolase